MEYLLAFFIFGSDGTIIKESVVVQSLAQCENVRDYYNTVNGRRGFAACSKL